MMTKAEVKTISNMVSGNRSHLSSREHRHEMQTDAIDRNSIAALVPIVGHRLSEGGDPGSPGEDWKDGPH